MPKLFAVSIILFLLLGAGYGASQAARSIPWDCADWQPFAHEDRATAILETLAENRGKTLYCGIDQSDTFTKAETWQAGKDRNERDDTVYWGERGSFRGFIAAQEGWLTDGESGITGQSIATIFEFPKEEQRGRRKKVKRFPIGTDPAQFPITAVASCGQVLGILCTEEAYNGGPVSSASTDTGRRYGRNAATGARPGGVGYGQLSTGRYVTWDTNLVYQCQPPPCTANYKTNALPTAAQWTDMAAAAADQACRAQGARYIANSASFGMGHSLNRKGSLPGDDHGPGLGFFLRTRTVGAGFEYPTRQSRTWSATCKKVIRGSRR